MSKARLFIVTAAASFALGCPKQDTTPPITLIADPPPTLDGRPPGADVTAMDRGTALIERQAWELAVPEFAKLIASNGKNGLAHYYHALALKNLGRNDEAKSGFNQAIALDANLVGPRVHLGEMLLMSDPPEPGEAIGILKQAVEKDPKAPDAIQLLAYAYHLQEKWGEAADAYTTAYGLEKTPDNQFQLADSLFRAKRVDEAVPHMRELIGHFKDDVKIVALLARRFGQAKAFDDCIKGFDKALGLKPNEAAFYFHRGVCKHKLGDEVAARNDYKAAIGANAKFQLAYYYLGRSLLGSKKRKQAADAFKAAIKIDPDSKTGGHAQTALDGMR